MGNLVEDEMLEEHRLRAERVDKLARWGLPIAAMVPAKPATATDTSATTINASCSVSMFNSADAALHLGRSAARWPTQAARSARVPMPDPIMDRLKRAAADAPQRL